VALEDLILLEVPMELKGKGKLTLHTTYKSFVVNSSLNQFEEQLPNYFIRINRFTLINSNFLSRYDHSEQCIYLREINNKTFNVGDKYKKVVLGLL
jgi:DNA-binding LytR/AlgR family response regulator